MKTLSFYLIVLISVSMCFACHHKDEKEIESDYLSSFINDMHTPKNIKWLVILPGMGCHGCIQEGEQFMKDNIKNKKIFFVLTQIESLKILQNKIGVNLKQQSNILADIDNKLTIPSNNSIYPCIVQLDNGKIKEHEFQCPQNGQAFYNLKSRLLAEKQE